MLSIKDTDSQRTEGVVHHGQGRMGDSSDADVRSFCKKFFSNIMVWCGMSTWTKREVVEKWNKEKMISFW